MARITTYEYDQSINGKDKLLGTDSQDSDATKNYLIENLVDYVSANINKGYKSYVCLLNQSGTTPPVPTVLENSLAIPDTPNPWQRQQAGIYNLIAPGIVATFPINKTIVFLNNGLSPTISTNIRWDRVSNSEIEVVVSTGDQYLVDASFEVRVYD
tara:strand:+ start:229 stop:696 length:468 start_codon:yes stop_codon:yes gene_type:complete